MRNESAQGGEGGSPCMQSLHTPCGVGPNPTSDREPVSAQWTARRGWAGLGLPHHDVTVLPLSSHGLCSS